MVSERTVHLLRVVTDGRTPGAAERTTSCRLTPRLYDIPNIRLPAPQGEV